MHWFSDAEFGKKYTDTVGDEKITTLVFSDAGCSESRPADELLTFLAQKVSEDNLKVLRFTKQSFYHYKLDRLLLLRLGAEAARSCQELELSTSRINSLGLNADALLEMAAAICAGSECLEELSLCGIFATKIQLTAVMKALIGNTTSTLKKINLTGNRAICENPDLL